MSRPHKAGAWRRLWYQIPTNIPEFIYTVILGPEPLKRSANAIIRRLAPDRVRYDGNVLLLNPDDPVVTGALALGVYERDETRCFKRLVRPGMTVVDIGANIGYYTVLAARLVRDNGRVIAFEPDPESFAILERNVEVNAIANVRTHAIALADKPGRLPLFRTTNNRADNRIYRPDTIYTEVSVTTGRLDDVLNGESGRVDVIKMDVQGAEGLVIAGMEETLRRNPDLVMLMEFWPWGLIQAGTEPLDLLRKLESLGLLLFDLGRNGGLKPVHDLEQLVERLPGRRYTNLVCARRQPYGA